MLKNPAQAMQWELLQAELLQQSLQNVYNLAAVPDPAIFQKVQARLAKCSTRLNAEMTAAMLRPTDVANLNAFAQPLIQSIGQGLGGLFGVGVNSLGNRNMQASNQASLQADALNLGFDYKDKPSQRWHDLGYNGLLASRGYIPG